MADTGKSIKSRDHIAMVLYVAYLVLLAGAVLVVGKILYIQLFEKLNPKLVKELTPASVVKSIEPERGCI